MHQQAETVPFSRRSKTVRAVLFVLLGIPGTIVFTFAVFFASGLLAQVIIYGKDPTTPSTGELVFLVVGLIGGGICLLIGSGRLRQWPYLAVFVVFGASLLCFYPFLQHDLALSVVPAGLMACGVSYLIHRFYARKSK